MQIGEHATISGAVVGVNQSRPLVGGDPACRLSIWGDPTAEGVASRWGGLRPAPATPSSGPS